MIRLFGVSGLERCCPKQLATEIGDGEGAQSYTPSPESRQRLQSNGGQVHIPHRDMACCARWPCRPILRAARHSVPRVRIARSGSTFLPALATRLNSGTGRQGSAAALSSRAARPCRRQVMARNAQSQDKRSGADGRVPSVSKLHMVSERWRVVGLGGKADGRGPGEPVLVTTDTATLGSRIGARLLRQTTVDP